MFLTKFDRKMYEEAIREEGRDEVREKYAQLSQKHAELSQDLVETSRGHAKRMFEKGISYEFAREVVTELSEAELKEIYGIKY